MVHSKDDIRYIPYDNKIAKNDNKTWTNAALTLPTHLKINSISEFGNYLAIGCAPLSSVFGNSIVYLWDRDSSLATLSESIDWGAGNLKVLQQIGNELIGISLAGNVLSRFNDRIIFRVYTASGAVEIAEFIFDSSSSTILPIAKQVIDNRLWFMMDGKVNGSQREGVWSIGRTLDGTFSIVHERTPDNDTALIQSKTLKNFILVGDFLFQAYFSSGVYALSKTNDQNTYSATAIRETTINPGMIEGDRTKKKQLEAVSLSYEPFPSGGSAVLEYRVDSSDGTWTTVLTETTSNKITTERTKIDAGTEFTSGREYEFRITTTSKKIVVTELKYKYSILETSI